MKSIKITIDISSPEGRQIVEELKQFPDLVSFEDVSVMEDPLETYNISLDKTSKKIISEKYIQSDLFWKLVENKRKKFCIDNDIV